MFGHSLLVRLLNGTGICLTIDTGSNFFNLAPETKRLFEISGKGNEQFFSAIKTGTISDPSKNNLFQLILNVIPFLSCRIQRN